MKSVVVHSSFLIGLFDETDPLHGRCRGFLRVRGRFLTTEAVLTEALALLSHSDLPAAQAHVLHDPPAAAPTGPARTT